MIALLASKIAYVTLAVLIGSEQDPVSKIIPETGAEIVASMLPVKKGVKNKLQKIIRRCTEYSIRAQNYEIEFKVIDEIVEALFNNEKLLLYLDNDKADKTMKNEIKATFNKNDIPYEEHNIDIEDLVGNILSNIYKEIQKDADLLTIDTNLNIHKLSNEFRIMLKHIKEMNANVEVIIESNENGLRTSNDAYNANFTEVMFLHKDTDKPQISLAQLFIMPKYITYDKTLHQDSIIDYLCEFINPEKKETDGHVNKNVLLIEGDGGIGKSALVSFMAYHFQQKTTVGDKLFKKRDLICVRLRNIIPEQKEFLYDDALNGILKYLNVDSLDDLKRQAQNSVIILDGFDELCMVQGMLENQTQYLNQIFEGFEGYKLIITTRPYYLQLKALNIGYKRIGLSHFDEELRGLWIENYKKVCEITDNPPNIKYLNKINDYNATGICDTPMSLYMIAAGKIDEEAQSNNWLLYHQIFYEELTATIYNSLFSSKTNISSAHTIVKHKDILYRLSAEIAYQMYKSNNVIPYISDVEISKIIKEMKFFDENMEEIEDVIEINRSKKIAKKCCAICNYWKTNEQKEAVEFYHNNIRDFFLCEKIFFDLNDLYRKIEVTDDCKKIAIFIEDFQKLFKYAELPEKVIEFIKLRIKYKMHKNKEDYFVNKELEKNYLSKFLQEMLIYGVLFEYKYSLKENALMNMTNILSNIFKLYSNLYKPYLAEGDRINLWRDVDAVNKSLIFNRLCKFVKKDLSHLNLKGVNLEEVNLEGVNLEGANLEGANLEGANLERANLERANLEGANLKGANLERANLEGANLEGANLEFTQLKGANLKGANLKEANLEGANFEGAWLMYANLEGQYFLGESKYFGGTNLTRANLAGANLAGAKLEGVKLAGANLAGVKLAGANLAGANLEGANLEGANLEETYLMDKVN